MAVGLAPTVANGLLNALVNQTNYTAPTVIAVQLHTGDPGAAGTANVGQGGAAGTTRKAITTSFPSAAGGAVTNDVEVAWSGAEVDASEDYTHYSVWDTATANSGNFLWSGTVTANPVTSGDQFKILVGDFDLSFPVAA
jgi:hypothetical protein